MDQPTFLVLCDTCGYRSEQPTREAALEATLRHRGGSNIGHWVRIENPPELPRTRGSLAQPTSKP